MGYVREPDAEELASMYRSAWTDAGGAGGFAAGSTSKAVSKSLLGLTGRAASDLGSCLDYGGGQGLLAEVLAAQGATDVSVIEPFGPPRDIPAVHWFSTLAGLPEGKRFDWVFMVEVIEHLLDPVTVLSDLRQFLTPQGALLITTPNARGLRARLEGARWQQVQNPVHINLFTPLSLRICLERAGYGRVRRLVKPVRYGSAGVARLALAATQLFGVDGGIRVIALGT